MSEGQCAPTSRTARHARIRALIEEGRISSQAELGEILCLLYTSDAADE